MFVIELIYKADLTEIDAQMAAHVRFLKKSLRFRQFSGIRQKDSARRWDYPGCGYEPAADRNDRGRRSLSRSRSGRLSHHRVSRQPARRKHPETDRQKRLEGGNFAHNAGRARIIVVPCTDVHAVWILNDLPAERADSEERLTACRNFPLRLDSCWNSRGLSPETELIFAPSGRLGRNTRP